MCFPLAFGFAMPATGPGWCPVAVAAGAAGGKVDFFTISCEAAFSSATALGIMLPLALGLAMPATGLGLWPSAAVAGPDTGLLCSCNS